jgi:hypothetical protein
VINEDGFLDLVHTGFNAEVFVHLGTAGDLFSAGQSILEESSLTGLAIGDFNRDGHSDVVASGFFAESV